MKDVSLRQLRAFEATMRLGRISAAANELHLTAPAVGQQLKRLRTTVGVEITSKTRDGFVPTSAGSELLATIARIDAELARCDAALEAIAAGSSGSVRFGALSTAKYFAPRLLARFRETHPEVRVQLLIGNRQETIDRLRTRGADIVVMGRPPQDIDLVVADIGPNPHVVIASPDHPLSTRTVVKLTDLHDEPFLVREPGSGTRVLADALFRDASLTPPWAWVVDSNETIKQAAMAGLGIGLISSNTIEAELESGRLSVLAVEGLPIVRRWYLARPAEVNLLPAGQEFWDFLVDQAEEQLAF